MLCALSGAEMAQVQGGEFSFWRLLGAAATGCLAGVATGIVYHGWPFALVSPGAAAVVLAVDCGIGAAGGAAAYTALA
jgi:hypothetical protein